MTQQMSLRQGPRIGLHDWLARSPGAHLGEVEKARIDEILPDLFGYHLVQVGRLGAVDLLAQSRVLHRLMVDIDGLDAPCPYPFIRARAAALPLESDSVDVLLLPHVLEFDDEPHEALREAFRVLVPEGHLLICGFNPGSPTGVLRWLYRRRGSAPWNSRFFGVGRIKDWLALLGFDVLQVSPCFIRPPIRNDRWLRRLDALFRLGNLTAPVLSGAYLMVARKRITTMTPIKTRWKPERRLVGVGLAEPSARVINGD